MEYKYTAGRLSGSWDGRFLVCAHRPRSSSSTSNPSTWQTTEQEGFRTIVDSVLHHPEQTLNILEDDNLHKSQAMFSWAVEEYHYVRTLVSDSGSHPQESTPIRRGPAINAHLPEGLVIEYTASVLDTTQGRWRNGIIVREGGKNGPSAFYE